MTREYIVKTKEWGYIKDYFNNIAKEHGFDSFLDKTRKNPLPSIRMVACHIITKCFPPATLSVRSSLLGIKNHSSVIVYLKEVDNLIYTVEKLKIKDYKVKRVYDMLKKAEDELDFIIKNPANQNHLLGRDIQKSVSTYELIKHQKEISEELARRILRSGKPEGLSRRIYLYDDMGNLLFVFRSIKMTIEYLGISNSHLYRYLDKEKESYYGYFRSKEVSREEILNYGKDVNKVAIDG